MASGEGQSNPSISGDAGGDHNEDYGNEYGPPLPTREELREMEHRRLVGEATNMMPNFAKDSKLAKNMTETAFQDVHAQWKATTTSPPKPDSKKQYSEKELEEEVEARLARILGAQDKRQKARQKAKEKHRFFRLLGINAFAKLSVVGYTDADFAGDLDRRRSTSGYLYTFAGGAISWFSRLQSCVTLSTIEAEYVATSESCKEAIWLTRLVGDLGIVGEIPVLHCDSQSAIQLARNPVFHSKTKHVDVRYHFIRDVLEDKCLQLVKVHTDDNPVDLLFLRAVYTSQGAYGYRIVLDVGTGSGILAIWAAQAGAKKVYAVEATKMAEHARRLAAGNGVQDIVEVIEGSIEDVELPEMVDVIISEWMGYFLIRESMFDSVIFARDRWLKPTGVMYPSHARMWVAPIKSGLGKAKLQDYENVMVDWDAFIQDTNDYYGVDMSVLTNPFQEEQKKYYLQTALWNNLHPSQIVGTPFIVKEFDCLTASIKDVANVQSSFQVELWEGQLNLSGFAGWFDVQFKGRADDPADQIIELTTAPSLNNSTHWGQQVFLVHPPLDYECGDILEGEVDITRSKDNHRLLDLKFTHRLIRSRDTAGAPVPFTCSNFFLE
ncbi:hypothetical protein L7F22_003945 [Adiantum nelumboides]|nr:hypothetical protein [Adiantum nelumboides]